MEFRILGPLEVWERGAPIELRQRRRRALLAVLLLRAGEIVSVDQLLDDLWGERPPPAAKGSLQNAVSALRRLLGSELLRTQAPGYLLLRGSARRVSSGRSPTRSAGSSQTTHSPR